MCISFKLSKYIYNELSLNAKLISYFKYSFVPEEMVIPTIIFNSSLKAIAYFITKTHITD